MRKHEAIETDIVAYSERVSAVNAVATELEAEGYHDIKRVLVRKNNVARLWDYLRELVAARRERLLLHFELQKMFQDLAYLMDWLEEMKVSEPVYGAVNERGEHPGGGAWHADELHQYQMAATTKANLNRVGSTLFWSIHRIMPDEHKKCLILSHTIKVSLSPQLSRVSGRGIT